MYFKKFRKILIANRGEIACRIIRTARRLGIQTVAIYSEEDVNSIHVKYADEAICVGPQSQKSYLSIPRIIDAIKVCGAEAVHPGYGFLSESSNFVEALEKEGILFIGPDSNAIKLMGDKIQSKKIATAANVNTIQGFDFAIENEDQCITLANQLGYPVLIKGANYLNLAASGGGGKGMRKAHNDQEIRDFFRVAISEAMSSFGDSRVFIEKYIVSPRHIEIQILGDKFGNVVYFPERECSIQRRNQKVVEESPSSFIDQSMRTLLGRQAVDLAKKVGYHSAGTVEFLVDNQRNHYFLELNTRLQVEHPVTEAITGIDLVEHMLGIAAGNTLEIKQTDIHWNGWAVESRVYAEDSASHLPSVGTLRNYIEPTSPVVGGSIRCDSGVIQGSKITVYYDPLMCKLITHAPSRDLAIIEMKAALDHYLVDGVKTNIPLLWDIMNSKKFQKGDLNTSYLLEEYPNGFKVQDMVSASLDDILIISSFIYHHKAIEMSLVDGKSLDNHHQENEIYISVDNSPMVSVSIETNEKYTTVTVNGTNHIVYCDWKVYSPLIKAAVQTDGKTRVLTFNYVKTLPLGFVLQCHGANFDIKLNTKLQYQLSKFMKHRSTVTDNLMINAPMPGLVVGVAVKVDQTVSRGQELATIEAMKMQVL